MGKHERQTKATRVCQARLLEHVYPESANSNLLQPHLSQPLRAGKTARTSQDKQGGVMKEIRPWYRWWWHRYSTSQSVLEFCLSTCPSSAHGCYRNLLDSMWQAGGSLPTNRQILWSLAKCGSIEEYERVADTVEKCFTKSDDGLWFSSKTLSEEWDSATALLEKKREAGRKGGLSRAKADAQAQPKQMPKHNSSTPQASSSSITVAVSSKSKSLRLTKGTRIPDDFQVTEEHRAWATCSMMPDPDSYIEAFRDYWKSKPGAGGVKLDWDATFRTWIRNDLSRNGSRSKRKVVSESEVGKWDGTIPEERGCMCYHKKNGELVMCPHCRDEAQRVSTEAI